MYGVKISLPLGCLLDEKEDGCSEGLLEGSLEGKKTVDWKAPLMARSKARKMAVLIIRTNRKVTGKLYYMYLRFRRTNHTAQ